MSVADSKLRVRQNLPENAVLLNRKKLQSIIAEFGEFPAEYRSLVWRFLLRLPENDDAFATLCARGIHPSSKNLGTKYPIKDRVKLDKLQRVCSALAHVSPIFAESELIPEIVFPFLAVFKVEIMHVFEAVFTILLNVCHDWFVYHPHPPLGFLDLCASVIEATDSKLHRHLAHINPQYSQILLWPAMRALFADVLTPSEWLRFIDHLLVLQCDRTFFVAFVAAYVRQQRVPFMTMRSEADMHTFARQPRPINIDVCLKTAHSMLNLPLWTEANIGAPFESLPAGDGYPVFQAYPEFTVNYHVRERERIQQELEARQRRETEAAEVNAQRRAAKEKITAMEDRLIQLEKKLRQSVDELERKKDIEEAVVHREVESVWESASDKARIAELEDRLRLAERSLQDTAAITRSQQQEQQRMDTTDDVTETMHRRQHASDDDKNRLLKAVEERLKEAERIMQEAAIRAKEQGEDERRKREEAEEKLRLLVAERAKADAERERQAEENKRKGLEERMAQLERELEESRMRAIETQIQHEKEEQQRLLAEKARVEAAEAALKQKNAEDVAEKKRLRAAAKRKTETQQSLLARPQDPSPQRPSSRKDTGHGKAQTSTHDASSAHAHQAVSDTTADMDETLSHNTSQIIQEAFLKKERQLAELERKIAVLDQMASASVEEERVLQNEIIASMKPSSQVRHGSKSRPSSAVATSRNESASKKQRQQTAGTASGTSEVSRSRRSSERVSEKRPRQKKEVTASTPVQGWAPTPSSSRPQSASRASTKAISKKSLITIKSEEIRERKAPAASSGARAESQPIPSTEQHDSQQRAASRRPTPQEEGDEVQRAAREVLRRHEEYRRQYLARQAVASSFEPSTTEDDSTDQNAYPSDASLCSENLVRDAARTSLNVAPDSPPDVTFDL